jgi:hypothetical protein
VQNILAAFTCLFLEISERKRDTVISSKEVADSVHLDPWRVGIVLFVLGNVLYLLQKFSLRLRVYSAHLDPQCAGVCPVRFG